MIIREYEESDLPRMIEIWNEVVRSGDAFPQDTELDERSGERFFAEQSRCAVAVADGDVCGLYILHPNNIGRCGHICNSSFAVDKAFRGRGAGRALVADCMKSAAELGFRILQFNAVVADNIPARRLYERMGFIPLGTIRGGFYSGGEYKDICPYYISLV